MRGFFLLLLLTNVAFLGWQYMQHDSGKLPDPYQGITFDKKGLTLLSELPPDKRPQLRDASDSQSGKVEPDAVSQEKTPVKTDHAAAPDSKTQEQKVASCFKIAGLDERDTADKLISSLKAIGAVALEQGSEQGEDTNYWVMLPPYKNPKQASAAAAALKEKNLRDFFIVRSGDYENAVSLGVFSTRERARRRYDQVVALKAKLRKPRIEQIKLPVKRYWVSWRLTEQGQHQPAEAVLDKLGLKKSKEISCQ